MIRLPLMLCWKRGIFLKYFILRRRIIFIIKSITQKFTAFVQKINDFQAYEHEFESLSEWANDFLEKSLLHINMFKISFCLCCDCDENEVFLVCFLLGWKQMPFYWETRSQFVAFRNAIIGCLDEFILEKLISHMKMFTHSVVDTHPKFSFHIIFARIVVLSYLWSKSRDDFLTFQDLMYGIITPCCEHKYLFKQNVIKFAFFRRCTNEMDPKLIRQNSEKISRTCFVLEHCAMYRFISWNIKIQFYVSEMLTLSLHWIVNIWKLESRCAVQHLRRIPCLVWKAESKKTTLYIPPPTLTYGNSSKR